MVAGARFRLEALVALALASSPVGCASVLDIEEAYEMTGGTGGDATGGSNASGGSGATSGTATGGVSSSGGTSGSTGAGGNAGSGAESGSGGSAGGVPQTLCGEYCSTVMANCHDDATGSGMPQYNNLEQCLAVCELLPPGAPNDRNVNTVECRLRLARQAEFEPLNVCPQAGIAGVGACGSSCEAYCGVMNQVCTETTTEGLSGHYYFDNAEDCLDACSEVPDMPPFSVAADLYGGNHLQCRLYHLLVSSLDGIEHCEHAIGYSICADE